MRPAGLRQSSALLLCSSGAKTGDEAMAQGDYDETRATARLPNADIELLHRRAWEGGEEQMFLAIRVVSSFDMLGRCLEAANPLLFWSRMMQMSWLPWLGDFPKPPPPH
jgi:hypothetical protein